MYDWRLGTKEDREAVFAAATIYDKLNSWSALCWQIKRGMESKEARAVVAAHQCGIDGAAKALKISKASVRQYVRRFDQAAYRKLKATPPKNAPRTPHMKAKAIRRIAAGDPLCGDVISALIGAHHLFEQGVNQNQALLAAPGEMKARELAMQRWLRQRQRESAKARRKYFKPRKVACRRPTP